MTLTQEPTQENEPVYFKFGGPYQVADETMERMLAAAVEGMVKALQEL